MRRCPVRGGLPADVMVQTLMADVQLLFVCWFDAYQSSRYPHDLGRMTCDLFLCCDFSSAVCRHIFTLECWSAVEARCEENKQRGRDYRKVVAPPAAQLTAPPPSEASYYLHGFHFTVESGLFMNTVWYRWRIKTSRDAQQQSSPSGCFSTPPSALYHLLILFIPPFLELFLSCCLVV